MFLKKISLTAKCKKQMCYKKKDFLFQIMKNVQMFPLEAGRFEHEHRILFSREIENIRSYKEVRLQKRIKFKLLR